jgi:hypothetical protein
VKFKCPSCDMQLKAEPEMAGKVVRCPGCNTKLSIPGHAGARITACAVRFACSFGGHTPPPSGDAFGTEYEHGSLEAPEQRRPSHPISPRNAVAGRKPTRRIRIPGSPLHRCRGLAGLVWHHVSLRQRRLRHAPQNTMDYIHDLFLERTWVNYTETFFFFWAVAVFISKWQKLRHQKDAMYLDVLPLPNSGARSIVRTSATSSTTSTALPGRLRDSMMVNRIRKGLELFEVRQNNGEVTNMMSAQSDIDGSRIGGSYSLSRSSSGPFRSWVSSAPCSVFPRPSAASTSQDDDRTSKVMGSLRQGHQRSGHCLRHDACSVSCSPCS